MIAGKFSALWNNDGERIRSLVWTELQAYVVQFVTKIASIFGPHRKNYCSHLWSNPIKAYSDIMEKLSKLNHPPSILIRGSMLWDLIEIRHLWRVMILRQMDWRQKFWIMMLDNGMTPKITHFRLVTGLFSQWYSFRSAVNAYLTRFWSIWPQIIFQNIFLRNHINRTKRLYNRWFSIAFINDCKI